MIFCDLSKILQLIVSTMQKLSYHKLQPFKSGQSKDKLTNEQRFWKRYQTKQIAAFPNPVSAISSNRNPQQLTLYAQGRSLSIFDTNKMQVTKEINTFNDVITALCLRPDSAVMAIGLESGIIEVMDTKQKFHLRSFRNHKKRVNAIEYRENELYSGGDDFVLRQFDVAAGEVVHSYANAHSDYIKCIRLLEENHILSAGYDGLVKLFDFRVHEQAAMEFVHGQQLESIDLFPSGMTFAACGGNKVSLWDVRTGRELFSARNNKKVVSAVRVVNKGARFVTGSYDQYLKVYKADTFELTYQDKLPFAIGCLEVTQNDQHLMMGLEGGHLCFKSRNTKAVEEETGDQQGEAEDELLGWLKKNEEKKFAYNDQHFYRGIYEKAQSYDIKFEQKQSRKVSQYDALLKKFQYKEALLVSLQKKNMMIYLSLVDEFIQRGCLERTLASLTEEEIEKMLGKLLPLIHNNKYAHSSVYVLQVLLEQHPQAAGWKGEVVTGVEKELGTIGTLKKLDGLLELLQHNFQ